MMSKQKEKGGMPSQVYQALVEEFNSKDDASLLGQRLDQLFEQIVRNFPGQTALIHNGIELSFQQLNTSANHLARCLAKRGLKHGDVVGLAVSRSMELVVVMLAVLKQGAAYVPIDPCFPAERINHMVEDANPKFILYSDSSMENLERWKKICFRVSDIRDDAVFDTTNLERDIQVQDLAYVIYTSGSTGRPKGVEISHGAASNFLSSLRKYDPGCNEDDCLLAITTISFDMSALELLLPLTSGATMIIANTSAVKDPHEIITLLKRHKATILQATPATWTMLLDAGWGAPGGLSKAICGGEPLTRKLADRLLSCADSVWNVYGPCETTYGSVGRVGAGDIVVGNPVANGRIYVLNDNLSPVPIGCEGEVFIGGSSVSNGYRNKPELTRSRFLNNPFHGGVFFRTGDLARFIGPGKLQVTGRIDGVVKIHGHRIEVGDIEAAITDHMNVLDTVVISRDDRLVAYCILDGLLDGASSLYGILHPWLAERLPAYMIPTFFVQMDAFPLSPSQKINRKALPDPIQTIENSTAMPPTSKLEEQIFTIWSDVLGHSRFGIEDNFFTIGGDSVRIIRTQVQLEKQLQRPVPTPRLFEYFTVKALASYLVSSRGESGEEACPAERFPCNSEDIAIISMACRLPGGIVTPELFWQLLKSGGDTVTGVPIDRWDAEDIYCADPDISGTSYCCRGGFLDAVYSHDASFFGISPREAQAMDPAQHLMLELGWEGFERAGYTKSDLSGSATGVFFGSSNNVSTNSMVPDLGGYSITGSASATMSGRVSYVLGLQGPSLTVDTACSSSLVATHLACNALRHGECSMALTGGVSLLLTPGIHIEFSKLRGLSVDGRCKAFSDDAAGTGFSDGAAVMVLKRLADAQRDGDDIHAIIRGSGVMHGGNTAGLTVPSGAGQASLLCTTLARTGMTADDVDYIEAHGTATKIGDSIEAVALAEVFHARCRSLDPVWLGSAKSNVGHTGAAAGLVGLLKVVLSLQNKILPKTLHVSEPTTAVDWKSANMELVLEERPWLPQERRVRSAGVSAFGIGGTNAHVIVQEFTSCSPTLQNNGDSGPSVFTSALPFVLSGNGDNAVKAQAEKLRLHIASGAGKDCALKDVAYSLATRRTQFRRRVVVTAETKPQLLGKLISISSGAVELPGVDNVCQGSLAMLFTGQGSQYLGMGKQLYNSYSSFRDSLNEIAAQFTELETPLLDIMWAEPGSANASLLGRTDIAQPALFALEASLYKLWRSWGVEPSFVLGHSVGEFAAAYVAGVFTLSDACRLVTMRGRLMQALPYQGTMASIEASGIEVREAIDGLFISNKVDIASYNTPLQTVISGDTDAVEVLVVRMAEQGRKTKILDTSHAFHSYYMNDMLDEFKAMAETVRFSPPKITFISAMTGRVAETGELEKAVYWVQQARKAVNFGDAFQDLFNRGAKVYLEVGPKPTLCGLGVACLASTSQVNTALWLPSLKPTIDEIHTILTSVAELHIRHLSINWARYFETFRCRAVPLPTYAFQRETPQHISKATNWRHFIKQAEDAEAYRRATSLDKMIFHMNWRAAKTDKLRPSGSWGLIWTLNETAWAQKVRLALSSTGILLVPVTRLQDAESLDGLLSVWDSYPDSEVVEAAHNLTTEALAQLQEVIRIGISTSLVWITRHAIGAGIGDEPVQIGAGPLWGLMGTARSEHPDLCLRLIDVDEHTELSIIGLALIQSSQVEIAIRHGHMLTPHMEPTGFVTSPPTAKPLLRTDGAVLITGGLGNIGARVAQRLVRYHGVRDLILISRRGKASPNAPVLVAALAQLGGKATIIGGNVADASFVHSLTKLFKADRPLRGVIHAAGVVDSGIIASLTAQKCKTTFAPKISGLWNLHQLTQHMDLDIFMMFSSISGVMGLPGLGNYAAANCFMDTLAYLRRAQGLPASSVAYGPWVGDGMAASLAPNTRAHLSQLGLGFLTPESGLHLLERAVGQGHPLTIAAVLDVQQLKTYYKEQGGLPLFLHSMLGHTKIANTPDEHLTLRDTIFNAAPKQHGSIILRTVQATIAKALGYPRIEDMDVNRPLQELGIDSLTAILIRNHLATLTGLALPSNIALFHENLEALSEFLLSQLLCDMNSSSTSDTGYTSPITLTPTIPRINMADIRRGVLDSNIQFDNVTKRLNACIKAPETVLLTGATGFVGAFMTHELVRRGIAVHCIVRADSLQDAQSRVVKRLKEYNLWSPEYGALLTSVVGDISQPLLGLSEAVFDNLSNKVDAIVHSGALVDWMRPLEDYVGPNILGTHEILRLSSHGRSKVVHFISTISTLPMHAGYGLSEQDVEYGYGTSKYLAERMVVAARFRGARASSYRLPFVSASTTQGQFRLDRGDFLNNLITGSIELGSFPSIDADLSAVLPVDYLSKTIATIVTQDLDRVGEDYDFLNPMAPTFDRFFKAFSTVSDVKEVVAFSEWHLLALEYAATHPRSSLASIMAIVDGHNDKTSGALMKGGPVGKHVLGLEDYPAPLLEESYVYKYLACIKATKAKKASN